MGIPKGYKLKDNTKDTVVRARLSNEDIYKLDYVTSETKQSRSDVIRKGIEQQYNQLGGVDYERRMSDTNERNRSSND